MRQPQERILFSNYYCDKDIEYVKNWLIEQHLEESPNDNKWVPSDADIAKEESYQEEILFNDFEIQFSHFIKERIFILQGTIGRYNGQYKGGFIFNTFNDLYEAWKDCDYIKIYDKNGHLYIECSHHDGDNQYEVRMLNKKGEEYYENHYYDDDRELHNKLMNSPYSILPNFGHKVYGYKKFEYENV